LQLDSSWGTFDAKSTSIRFLKKEEQEDKEDEEDEEDSDEEEDKKGN